MNKKYGFCHLSVIPVRKAPDHKSEMVSQLIFGETFLIVDIHDIWVKIESTHDKYKGWIHFLQFLEITEDEYFAITSSHKIIIKNNLSKIYNKTDNYFINLPAGSIIYGSNFSVGNKTYIFDLNTISENEYDNSLTQNAQTFLGSPYLWGGRTLYGIDCSGFTQILYRIEGINIPRDAYQQASLGETIAFIDQAVEGDLLFFGNEENTITHVGIYLGNREIIHASGLVKINSIDQFGIFCPFIKKYTHTLRLIKRLLPE